MSQCYIITLGKKGLIGTNAPAYWAHYVSSEEKKVLNVAQFVSLGLAVSFQFWSCWSVIGQESERIFFDLKLSVRKKDLLCSFAKKS